MTIQSWSMIFKKKNVALFEANPHFIENHTSYYYAALYNFMICCRRTGRHEELIEGIKKNQNTNQTIPLSGTQSHLCLLSGNQI